MQIGSGAGLQPLALGTPCNLSLDFFAVSFHVSAYRYGGNNVQQLEAVRCGLGRLTTCVIWTITKKFPVPQIKPYIDSCAAVYYGDARNHWCQSRCYLGSTVKRWVSSRAQHLGSSTSSSEEGNTACSPHSRLSSETCLFESTDAPRTLMENIYSSNQLPCVSKDLKPQWSVRNDA